MKQVSNILTEERKESRQLEENCVDHDAGGLGGGSLEKSKILWLLILSFFLYTIFWFASCRTIMGSSHAQRNSPAYREPQQDQGQGQQEEL